MRRRKAEVRERMPDAKFGDLIIGEFIIFAGFYGHQFFCNQGIQYDFAMDVIIRAAIWWSDGILGPPDIFIY